jgi:hypothetical protein
MSRCKLIMVEGIPGSGKTTLAAFVKGLLDHQGISNRLYCEGDLDHPADFEAVAHFNCHDYEAFLSHFASWRQVLEQNVVIHDEDYFLAYRKLKLEDGQTLPDELVNSLAQHDVYEIPSASTYCRLAAKRWQEFAEKTVLAEDVTIFESCFLQNPLTVLIGKHNVTAADAIRHLRMVTATIQPLQPIVIYLWQPDTRAALERIARERPSTWKEFLIGYFTQQGWGKATGASGFDGVIAFYEMRKRLEFELLRDLEMTTLLLDNTHYDWTESQRAVTAFLSDKFAMA